MKQEKNVALFGGTFDPVHLGHLELAKTAVAAARLDRVIFIPCWQSPFKGKTIATSEQRHQMLRLALAECAGGDRFQVSDYEISRPGPSYSWQTALHFRESEKEVRWHWILGTDQWEQIESWARPEELRSQLSFVVMTRGRAPVRARDGWRYQAVPFHHEASASLIREDFARHRHWLP